MVSGNGGQTGGGYSVEGWEGAAGSSQGGGGPTFTRFRTLSSVAGGGRRWGKKANTGDVGRREIKSQGKEWGGKRAQGCDNEVNVAWDSGGAPFAGKKG